MRSIRRLLALSGAILGVMLLVPLTHVLAANSPGSRPSVPCPSFDAGNFHKSTTINNPYFPLVPGTRFTYKGSFQKTSVVDIVTVMHNVVTLSGVKTIEVRDQVFEAGVLREDTLDWYAQDDVGNVWYFGELATELRPALTTAPGPPVSTVRSPVTSWRSRRRSETGTARRTLRAWRKMRRRW